MTRPDTIGLTLDTGALLALERRDRRVRALLRTALTAQRPIAIPAGVIAQAWRGGPRQAEIARLLASETVRCVWLDEWEAKEVGLLSGRCGHADIVDVHVALIARRRGDVVVTSDPGDIAKVDPRLRLFVV